MLDSQANAGRAPPQNDADRKVAVKKPSQQFMKAGNEAEDALGAGEKPFTRKSDIVDAYDLISLFKIQALEASGDGYVKWGIMHRPKKHYVELRGATMVMFRNADIAASQGIQQRDILAVLVLKYYNVSIEKRQGQSPRIYLTGPGIISGQCMFIKVLTERDLESWGRSLASAGAIALPTLHSMTVQSIIGQGGGGKVFLVHHRLWNKSYALKVIDKKHTFSNPIAFKHVVSERSLMQIVGNHPYVLKMCFAFQTERNLFIGTPFCRGGDLGTYLKNQRRKHGARSPENLEAHEQTSDASGGKKRRYGGHLSEAQAKSLLAEILLALEHLHERGIVYRDLKPENVLIADDGHLRLADFGLSKHLKPAQLGFGFERTSSICGTRNYLPPEMLQGKPYGCEADMWSFGVMIFRILCGRFPFEAQKTREMFSKVKREKIRIPPHISPDGADLLEGLLCRDQARRLTAKEAKNQSFFREIDWNNVLQKTGAPPIKDLSSERSTLESLENFDLSKLYDISMGERVYTNDEESIIDLDQNSCLDPAGRILGFEYAAQIEDMEPSEPMEVQRVSGVLSHLTSLPSSSSDSSSFSWRRSGFSDFVKTRLSPKLSTSRSRFSFVDFDQSARRK